MALYPTDMLDEEWNLWDELTWEKQPQIDTSAGPIWSGPVTTREQDNWMWLDITSYMNHLVNSNDFTKIPAYFSFAMVPLVEPGIQHYAVFSSANGWYNLPEYSITYNPNRLIPSKSSRFRTALRNCHLQFPLSRPVAVYRPALQDFSNWFYFLTPDDTMMISQYGGRGRRTELLHEKYWDSDSRWEKMMNVTFRMPTPPAHSGVRQVTIAQIHHLPEYGETDGPLLRMHYRDNDSLTVNIRVTQTPKKVRSFALLSRWPDNEWINVETRVFRQGSDTMLTVKVNGEEKIVMDINYWEFHKNYFKAGAYMSATETSTHVNTVEFKQLDIFT